MNQMQYGVRLTTARRLDRIEHWLERHCHGAWAINIDGISNDLVEKTISIQFERAADRRKFREACGNLA